jgi:SNF2 family DNA or RNA helicase
MVNEFNARGSTVSVFLISTAAGGVGLNLQGANKVVIVDPSWSPAADLQVRPAGHAGRA